MDIDVNGNCSDAQIYYHSALKEEIESRTMAWPPEEPLHNNDGRPITYFIVGDDACAIQPWLQKTYSRPTGRQ